MDFRVIAGQLWRAFRSGAFLILIGSFSIAVGLRIVTHEVYSSWRYEISFGAYREVVGGIFVLFGVIASISGIVQAVRKFLEDGETGQR